jgi:glyoxylase-like metal-dependent hydrolase (beta-lactamase superfamily II)
MRSIEMEAALFFDSHLPKALQWALVYAGDGMTILPMPGETPGHQILHLVGDTEWQNINFAGDLYHHQIEFVDEARNVGWSVGSQSAPGVGKSDCC